MIGSVAYISVGKNDNNLNSLATVAKLMAGYALTFLANWCVSKSASNNLYTETEGGENFRINIAKPTKEVEKIELVWLTQSDE